MPKKAVYVVWYFLEHSYRRCEGGSHHWLFPRSGKSHGLCDAKEGQKVVVNYIAGCQKAADATVKEIKGLSGDAISIQGDCSDPTQMTDLFKQAVDNYGHIGCPNQHCWNHQRQPRRSNEAKRLRAGLIKQSFRCLFLHWRILQACYGKKDRAYCLHGKRCWTDPKAWRVGLEFCFFPHNFINHPSQSLRYSFWALQAKQTTLRQREESSVWPNHVQKNSPETTSRSMWSAQASSIRPWLRN